MHAWGIYIVVGLSLAYFSFRKGLPLSIRSAFYPVLGDRIHGPMGHTIDVLAIFGTLFGVATSLGLGVMQVNAGLDYLLGTGITTPIQVGLIAGITLIATASVVLGLDKGIRRLSNFNMAVAGVLLAFVFLAGPTVFILKAWMENTGNYVQSLVATTFWLDTWGDGVWQGNWTLFYWGWWIAWSPFVGMFIARISRGRTIREFVAGVLFMPAAVGTFWLTTFGNTALRRELVGEGGLAGLGTEEMLFALLQGLPLASLTSVLGMTVIIAFFVTSSDSGSLVIDMLASGGHPDPPVAQRVFWALLEGVVAAVLLLTGGLMALQTAAIATGLPFAVVVLGMCYSLFKALRDEQPAPTHIRKIYPAERREGTGGPQGPRRTKSPATGSSPKSETRGDRHGGLESRTRRAPRACRQAVSPGRARAPGHPRLPPERGGPGVRGARGRVSAARTGRSDRPGRPRRVDHDHEGRPRGVLLPGGSEAVRCVEVRLSARALE
ncbi:MAG: BCCT family transporter [Gemmatimonadota bacterium]|nr:BCCT family transporter [Gemmatimonadota bacterium]